MQGKEKKMQENLTNCKTAHRRSDKISSVLFNYSDSKGLESFIVIAQNSREVLDIYQGPGDDLCRKYANPCHHSQWAYQFHAGFRQRA